MPWARASMYTLRYTYMLDLVARLFITLIPGFREGLGIFCIMVTLYTLMGLYGNFDKHFIFYCAWDILKAISFQPDSFMLLFELTLELWAREACVMDILAYVVVVVGRVTA